MKDKTNFTLRKAEPGDEGLLLNFIRKIAEYEKLSHEVTATEELLQETLFCEHPRVEALLGFADGEPIAYAVYFYNFSTFKGKLGLYLEDLFVLPEYRGSGFGKKILLTLAQIAHKKKCGRFEWCVLDWNTPAIEFYKSLGAVPMDEWTIFRLEEEGIARLAEQAEV